VGLEQQPNITNPHQQGAITRHGGANAQDCVQGNPATFQPLTLLRC